MRRGRFPLHNSRQCPIHPGTAKETKANANSCLNSKHAMQLNETQENLPDAIDAFAEPDAQNSTDLIGVPNAPDTSHATVLAHINNMLEHGHILKHICLYIIGM